MLGANTIWDLDVDYKQLLGWATVPIFVVGDSEVSLWSLVMLIGFAFLAAWSGRRLRVSAQLSANPSWEDLDPSSPEDMRVAADA